nr:MAG TPA: hypothetical protein [Caudoviricetes sp.]
MCYYCLHQFHWEPSKYMNLDRYHKAVVDAAVKYKIENRKNEE